MEELNPHHQTLGYYGVEKLSLLGRIKRRLFPARPLMPADPEPGFAEGELLTNVMLKVDWLDRLRILCSGRAQIEVRHQTDVVLLRVSSRASFYVLPPGRG
jgi:hypothetical protein